MIEVGRRSLRNIAIFQGLSAEALGRWEAHCKWRTAEVGARILETDDQSRDVYFLVAGKVQVIVYSVGGQIVLFRDIEAGGTFGEFAAIDNKRRSACVEAAEPCLIAIMSAANFKKLLKRDNAVTMAMLEHAIAQIRALTNRVFEFSTLAVNTRIQAELLRLAQEGKTNGREVRIRPFPRHVDIAHRISTHREAVTRELASLKRQGLVRREGDVFIIKDLPRLAEMVREVEGG